MRCVDEPVREKAQKYFRRKGLSTVLSLFKFKIESLGYVGGSVKLHATEEEKKNIEAWMGKKYKTYEILISLQKFEKRLKDSIFEEINLKELIEIITGEPIIDKNGQNLREELRKTQFFESLCERYSHPNARLLINKIRNRQKGYTVFKSAYQVGNNEPLETILNAVSNFPLFGDFERLPVFAERITGNPHYFDKNKKLIQAIEMIVSEKDGRDYRSQLNAEEEVELLELVGLAKDDLHSFCTIYGLEAYIDGHISQQWHWANIEMNLQNIPLYSLRRIERIEPVIGNKVYVIENSGVYSSIVDKLDSVYPVVCTHGNLKLSGLLLLQKLAKSGTEIYYSGDFDPKGIAIAKHIQKMIPKNFHIWRMGVEEYKLSLSSVPLSVSALERLNVERNDEFYEVVIEMKKEKKAGYQEALLETYVQDIKQ